MPFKSHLSLHLTRDMKGILLILGGGRIAADSLSRVALAVLASYGAVDIVSGVASLTSPIGIDLLAKAGRSDDLKCRYADICDACDDLGCDRCEPI